VFKSHKLICCAAQVGAAGGSIVAVNNILSAVLSVSSGRWQQPRDDPNHGPKAS
jgi:hypothetical protein